MKKLFPWAITVVGITSPILYVIVVQDWRLLLLGYVCALALPWVLYFDGK